MADEKKPESSGDPKAAVFAEIVSLFLVLMIVLSLVNSLSARWNIRGLFSGGVGGLNAKSILLSHTRPISSLYNPIGARVISLNKTDVYDSPGGRKIGSQKVGARGKILQGPVDINGERYWYVDYDSGPDGWVKESDIAYLETEPNVIERFIVWIWSILPYVKWGIVIFSILVFIYILYLNSKISPILKNQRDLLYPVTAISAEKINPKWEKIISHLESLNENDWRIAIIEADIMLGELLEKLSLPGDTIGDKLKAVEKSDFTTLDDAWEAHKIRNRISHDGQTFMINQRDARVVIGLYEKVFREFEVI
ncbi:MAG: hypothetical protein AB201_00720 [Parcubacteria bacterium C7867-006]|nr:MAG: hypothetical protein AB201_00720 [Parcubacteria bacterium C7867-006]